MNNQQFQKALAEEALVQGIPALPAKEQEVVICKLCGADLCSHTQRCTECGESHLLIVRIDGQQVYPTYLPLSLIKQLNDNARIQ